MFTILGGSVARPRSQPRHPSRVPWIKILLVVTIIVAAIVGITVASERYSDSIYQEQVTTVPAVSRAPVPESQVVVPITPAPAIVDYRVTWVQVRGFDPFALPTEEGFYSGEFPREISWSPTDPSSIPVGDAFAWKVLPHLKEVGRGNRATAVRAVEDRNVVLASIDAESYGPYTLLSVDGEKSWCTLNVLPAGSSGRAAPSPVRVVAKGDEIHLYGRYALGPGPDYLYWWTATVNKGELPCS